MMRRNQRYLSLFHRKEESTTVYCDVDVITTGGHRYCHKMSSLRQRELQLRGQSYLSTVREILSRGYLLLNNLSNWIGKGNRMSMSKCHLNVPHSREEENNINSHIQHNGYIYLVLETCVHTNTLQLSIHLDNQVSPTRMFYFFC